MKGGSSKTLVGSLLLVASMWCSVGQAAAVRGAKSASHLVNFRNDDVRAQRIARKMLRKEISEEQHMPSGLNSLRTAWVKVSDDKAPELFVTYGCSATGNCDLYGFDPARSGWRLVLDSLAQTCSILPSSHGGRRDISASMHGSATESTIKTYWWRRNRTCERRRGKSSSNSQTGRPGE
jgi:hypothetical protein